jgi:hypothetical protein
MKLFYVKIDKEDFVVWAYNHLEVESWAQQQANGSEIFIEDYNPNKAAHIVAFNEDGNKVI